MSKYVKKIEELKNKSGFAIYVKRYHSQLVKLRVINRADLNNKNLIKKLSDWRRRDPQWAASIFSITTKRTKRWLRGSVINKPDRILFAIENDKGKLYGHLGFNRFRLSDNSCELDSVVRGMKEIPGLMTDCVNCLIKWGFKNLEVSLLYLTTFDDNKRAVNLYKRCGFKKIGKIPLKKIRKGNELQWVKIPIKEQNKAQRFYARMVLKPTAI